MLCALALVVLSVWEIAVLARARSSAPLDEEWRQAAAWVSARHQPGDLIVFAPAWVDPVGRKWLGDRMTIAQAARMDDARYGRVFEVSIRGAGEARGTLAAEERFGPIDVRLWQRPAATVHWELAGALYEVDFAPRRCQLVRPPGQLDAEVEMGDALVVYAGIADFRSRRDNRARALLRVFVDDKEAARASIGNDSGWQRLAATTTPGRHRLRITSEVDGAGSPAKLDLCVAAEARTEAR